MNCLCSINTHAFHSPSKAVVVVSYPPPTISNYNFASPTVSNNTYNNIASVPQSTAGSITTSQNVQWSFTAGNNVGSLQVLLCLGTHILCSVALNYPSTNSQYICVDIADKTSTGTSWVMMYQNLVFPAGTRTVTWYMCTSDTTWSWCSGAYVTASVGGISGATQNYTITSNSWVQKSFTFTVPTAGTYPLQFTTGVTNPTGYAISNIGAFVIT